MTEGTGVKVTVKFGGNLQTHIVNQLNSTFTKQLQQGILRFIVDEAKKISRLKLRQIALAMSQAGNQEFHQLRTFIMNMVGVNSNKGTTTLWTLSDPSIGQHGDPVYRSLLPNANSRFLPLIRAQGGVLIWRALKREYFGRKIRGGKPKFFVRTGALQAILPGLLDRIPDKVGPIKVSFDNAGYQGQSEIKNVEEIFGFFRITLVKKTFVNLMPGFTTGNPTDIDPSMRFERKLFGDDVSTKLGAFPGDASRGSNKFPQRHMIQPVTAWFLLEQVPAAMARAAADLLR